MKARKVSSYYQQSELRLDTRRAVPWLPSSGERSVAGGAAPASRPLTGCSAPAGTRALALRLGALRMLLFKLLLLDVLLTCSRLRAPAAARQDPAGASGPGARGLPAPSGVPQADSRLLSQPPPPQGSSAGPADRIRRSHGGTRGRGLSVSASPALEPGTAAASGFAPAVRVGIPGTQSGRRGRRFSGPGARDPPSVFPPQALEHFSILCLLQRTRASPGASLRQTEVLSELKNLCLSH